MLREAGEKVVAFMKLRIASNENTWKASSRAVASIHDTQAAAVTSAPMKRRL